MKGVREGYVLVSAYLHPIQMVVNSNQSILERVLKKILGNYLLGKSLKVQWATWEKERRTLKRDVQMGTGCKLWLGLGGQMLKDVFGLK